MQSQGVGGPELDPPLRRPPETNSSKWRVRGRSNAIARGGTACIGGRHRYTLSFRLLAGDFPAARRPHQDDAKKLDLAGWAVCSFAARAGLACRKAGVGFVSVG